MQQRYDVEWLSREYQVGYCQEAQDWCKFAQGRIIIPVFKNGRLAGWQARSVGPTPAKHVPKYMSEPGMPRRQLLYNWDVAANKPFVALVEGPTATWTFGPEAAGLFGKTCNFGQIAHLTQRLSRPSWHTQNAPWKAVLILLDGNAYKEAVGIYDGLRGVSEKSPRILINLPQDKQPGDYTRSALRRLVYDQAKAEGVEIEELLHDLQTTIQEPGAR
jgi:hypothetical protein